MIHELMWKIHCYILEIQTSNSDISNIKYFEDIAGEYGVKLRFTEEIQ